MGTDNLGQLNIFLPTLAVVALTIVGFVRLAVVRWRLVLSRQMPLSYYRAHQGREGRMEPELAAAAARHYANLFESPVLFYFACTVAFLTGAVSTAALAAAWGYALARIVQSAIHLSTNSVRHRAYAFLAAWAFLAALWAMVAVHIVASV